MAVIFIFWPSDYAKTTVTWKRLDFVGCTLFLALTVLLIFALQEAGAGLYSWNSATIIIILVAAGLAAIALSVWIWLLSTRDLKINPIFPATLVTRRVSAAIVSLVHPCYPKLITPSDQPRTTFLTGFTFYSIVINLPERFQIVNGDSPENAGVHLLPLLGGSAVGSGLGGILSSRRNRTFPTLVVANALILIGCGLMSTIDYGRSLPKAILGYEAIYGTGVGLTMSSCVVATNLQNTPENNGMPT